VRATQICRPIPLIGAALALVLLASACNGGGEGQDTARSGDGKAAGRVEASSTFSKPTSITNPLFPIRDLAQVIQLGEEEGETLRVEVTLLPGTKAIEWNGQRVETLVSQFVEYSGGELLEVALDYFAQADDGSVWYFGEDVDNYEKGVIADHEGSWLAGKDGPPGVIMPAKPKTGDVYRPENIPGLVFEEVTVKAIDEPVDGPRGLVAGAILVQERLMEGATEEKYFAPGYGEFQARATDELLTVALAVPIDALSGPPPAELGTLLTGANKVFDAAPSKRWDDMAATAAGMEAAWKTFRAGQVPKLLEAQMNDALNALGKAVKARKATDAQRAATDVAEAALDLELRHRPVAEVDLDRLDVWARRLLVHSGASDGEAMAGDVAVLETIWKRVRHAVDEPSAKGVDPQLAKLRAAAGKEDAAAVAGAVPELQKALASLPPPKAEKKRA
jgi:hypothetical protein